MKLVIATYSAVLGILLAQILPSMTVLQMVMASAAASFVGGVACAMRDNKEPRVWLAYGINTSLLGVGLSSIAHPFIVDKPGYEWLVVGVCAIVSLGGLASIDWVYGHLKRYIEKKASRDDKR